MDQSIYLDHQKTDLSSKTNSDYYAETFFYEPKDTEQQELRGSFIAIVEAHNYSPKDLDLPKLVQEINKKFLDDYYSTEEVGSPLEALELAYNRAKEINHTLTDNSAELKIALLAVWGKALIYFNPNQLPIGIRRNQEFFELDQTNYGNQELKDDDLIIVPTQPFFELMVKPTLREKQSLNNHEFSQALGQPESHPETEEPLKAELVYVNIDKVPSEEEIIEIHFPDSETKKKQSTQFSFPNPIRGLLGKTAKSPEVNPEPNQPKPKIYLKPNLPQGKTLKLFLLVLFLILLTISLLITYQIRMRKQEELAMAELIEETEQKLERARELNQLNPVESLDYLKQAQDALGQVAGVHTEYNEEIETLLEKSQAIADQVYKVSPTQTTPIESNSDVIKNYTVLWPNQGIYQNNGTKLLDQDPVWQNPIQVEAYFGNLYVLDPTAQSIWKHIGNNGNYTEAQDYLVENADLSAAKDLAIDGSIYILIPEQNQAIRFTLGKRDDFQLIGVFPAMSPNSQIATEPESNSVYVSSPRGILVFDKDGKYQKLLTGDEIANIETLISADKGKTVYFLKDQQWHSISNL